MNEFGSDENKETEIEGRDVIVPKPSADLPQGFTPLVPSSALEELGEIPDSFDEEEGESPEEVGFGDDEVEGTEDENIGTEEGEVKGPDVESIFAKVVAESELKEAGEEEADDSVLGGVAEVEFNVPKVKPVMLSAASVYGVMRDEVEEEEEEEPEVISDESTEEDDSPEEESPVIFGDEKEEDEMVESDEVEEIVIESESVDFEEEEAVEDEVIVEEAEDDFSEEVIEDSDEEEPVEKSVLESLAEAELEDVAEELGGDDDEEEADEEDEVKSNLPDAAVVAGLVAKAKEEQSDVNEMEVMDPEREKTRELFQPEKQSSGWAFWRRPSKRDQQLARVSEGYLEMVDMVRAIRNQMESQNENNIILRDSLSHLPVAMKGLETFSKSQQTVGKALKEIHGQLKNSGAKEQKLVESMDGFNDTLRGMDDTGKETMKTFDRVQERMRDSDIRMENLFQNVQNTEEKVGDTMVRLQRNMAIMQSLFLFCLMIVIGVLVYTVIGNNKEKDQVPEPVKKEEVVIPREEE